MGISDWFWPGWVTKKEWLCRFGQTMFVCYLHVLRGLLCDHKDGQSSLLAGSLHQGCKHNPQAMCWWFMSCCRLFALLHLSLAAVGYGDQLYGDFAGPGGTLWVVGGSSRPPLRGVFFSSFWFVYRASHGHSSKKTGKQTLERNAVSIFVVIFWTE